VSACHSQLQAVVFEAGGSGYWEVACGNRRGYSESLSNDLPVTVLDAGRACQRSKPLRTLPNWSQYEF
jgi:hypothetical protein